MNCSHLKHFDSLVEFRVPLSGILESGVYVLEVQDVGCIQFKEWSLFHKYVCYSGILSRESSKGRLTQMISQ